MSCRSALAERCPLVRTGPGVSAVQRRSPSRRSDSAGRPVVRPLIGCGPHACAAGGTTVLHDIDLTVDARRVRRRGRRQRRRQDDSHPGDRRRRPRRRAGRCASATLDLGRANARTLSSRIGFVFQNPEHQFIAHTVFDEIAHGLRLRHLPDDEVRERTVDAARAVRTRRRRQTSHPFLLSGGQKRRLSVGTALVAGAPRARARRADVRAGPRTRRRAARAAARAERRGNHDRRRHPRHAAGDRVRRPHRRLADGRIVADGRHRRCLRRRRPYRVRGPSAAAAAARAAGLPRHPEPRPASLASPICPGRRRDRTVTAVRRLRTVRPYADASGQGRFLYGLNPLAKLAAPLPAMLLLVFVRDAATPAAFLVLSYLVLLVGVKLHPARDPDALRRHSRSGLGDRSRVRAVDRPARRSSPGSSVLADRRLDALRRRARGRLRHGPAARGDRRARAHRRASPRPAPTSCAPVVQQLRVPYRIGYTALAAFRFVPRFGHELDVIRQAHRVRGAHGGRGPFAAIARWFGLHRPAARGRHPPRGTRRPRDGRARLRRTPRPHRTPPRALARARRRLHRAVLAWPPPRSSHLLLPLGTARPPPSPRPQRSTMAPVQPPREARDSQDLVHLDRAAHRAPLAALDADHARRRRDRPLPPDGLRPVVPHLPAARRRRRARSTPREGEQDVRVPASTCASPTASAP